MRSSPQGRRSPVLALAAAVLLSGACVDRRLPMGPEDSGSADRAGAEGVAVPWVTTADRALLLEPQPGVRFAADGGFEPLTIDVDEGTRFQQITGFGAAVTGSSAWLIQHRLPGGEREALIGRLFDPSRGIGLSFLRLAMGASDFSLRSYTYDDLPQGEADPGMERFSIAPDRAEIIPVVRQARAANPALRVMASPWTAPAWMKTNGGLNGGSLRRDAYAAYARYFQRFVAEYAAEGIPIHAVTVQNEPHHEAPYPSMRMTAAEQAAFIRDHLGPLFAEQGVSTRILAWDHNWDEPGYALSVLADAGAGRYVAGAAFHCYAGDVSAQTQVRDAFPGKDIYFTECSGGEWSTDFGVNLAWNLRHLVIGATRNWAKSVLLWNLALDPGFGPTNGGCRDCRGVVTVDPASGAVRYNVEYYALGHASKFVAPGAFRIASNSFGSGSIENVAFRNLDGSKVLVVLNSAPEKRTFKVRWSGRSFRYTLPAGAAATFRWS